MLFWEILTWWEIEPDYSNAGQGISNNEWYFSNRCLLEWKTCSPQKIVPVLLQHSLPYACWVVHVAQIPAFPVGEIWLLQEMLESPAWGSADLCCFFIGKSSSCQLLIHFTFSISFLWWCRRTGCCSRWENFESMIQFSQTSVNLLEYVKSEFIN